METIVRLYIVYNTYVLLMKMEMLKGLLITETKADVLLWGKKGYIKCILILFLSKALFSF